MRIDRYWKQAAAGLLAMMMFMTAGGGMDSFAMTDSQPFKAQGQALTAPDKIIIKDDQDHGQSSQSGQTAPVIQQIQSTNGQAGGGQTAGQAGGAQAAGQGGGGQTAIQDNGSQAAAETNDSDDGADAEAAKEELNTDMDGCLPLQAQKLTEAEARGTEVLGSYVPTVLPKGYGFESASRNLDRQEENLTLCWSRGMDSILLGIEKPDSAPDTVDIARAETYDVRLYEIPYGETVPEEYREIFQDPVFAIEDLSLEIIRSRVASYQDRGDTATPRGNFRVLYPDGVLVRFNGRGTPEEIWEMFCSMGE